MFGLAVHTWYRLSPVQALAPRRDGGTSQREAKGRQERALFTGSIQAKTAADGSLSSLACDRPGVGNYIVGNQQKSSWDVWSGPIWESPELLRGCRRLFCWRVSATLLALQRCRCDTTLVDGTIVS